MPEAAESQADYIKITLRIRDKWYRGDEEQRRKEGKAAPGEPPTDFWFRGQAKAIWSLKPRLYRTHAGTNRSEFRLSDEDEIRTDFKRRGRQLLSESELPAKSPSSRKARGSMAMKKWPMLCGSEGFWVRL